MSIRKYKPTSPGRRFMTVSTFEEITKKEPEKSLLAPLKKKGGRNSYGRITVRHRGGGTKQKYRIIDFKRDKDGIPGTVKAIEYDPNRSANIALIYYADGEKRYILAPHGLKVGDTIYSGEKSDIKPGNAMPLMNIPVGTVIHNIELKPGKGGQLVRAAGNMAQLWLKRKNMHRSDCLLVKRRIDIRCKATIGQVGNLDHENITIGKAGRKRWMVSDQLSAFGHEPSDHPHGGGEGRSPIGMPSP